MYSSTNSLARGASQECAAPSLPVCTILGFHAAAATRPFPSRWIIFDFSLGNINFSVLHKNNL